jgi:hypothetical protein
VETIVAVIIAAAAMTAPPAAIRNPEYALNGSHRAADAGAHRATNYAAHRAGNSIAFVCALLRASDKALRMPELRDREQCENDCRSRKIKSYGQTGRQRRCLDPVLFHLNSLVRAAIAPAGQES